MLPVTVPPDKGRYELRAFEISVSTYVLGVASPAAVGVGTDVIVAPLDIWILPDITPPARGRRVATRFVTVVA